MQMPMVAQAILLGGNVRVGLEDNLYLEKGVLATNGKLVERACQIVAYSGRACFQQQRRVTAWGSNTPGHDGFRGSSCCSSAH